MHARASVSYTGLPHVGDATYGSVGFAGHFRYRPLSVGSPLFLVAAVSTNDRDRTAQQCQGTHCLTGVNLRRRYSAVIVWLIVPRFVIVRLIDTAGGKGEVCSERQYDY